MDKLEQLDVSTAYLKIARDKKYLRDRMVSSNPIILDIHDSVVVDCISSVYEESENLEDYLTSIILIKINMQDSIMKWKY